MDKFLAKHTTVPGAQPAYPFSKLYYALHKKYGDSAIVRTKKGKTREEL
jgi:hypothetical protein